jgi:hypothetical protein
MKVVVCPHASQAIRRRGTRQKWHSVGRAKGGCFLFDGDSTAIQINREQFGVVTTKENL